MFILTNVYILFIALFNCGTPSIYLVGLSKHITYGRKIATIHTKNVYYTLSQVPHSFQSIQERNSWYWPIVLYSNQSIWLHYWWTYVTKRCLFCLLFYHDHNSVTWMTFKTFLWSIELALSPFFGSNHWFGSWS